MGTPFKMKGSPMQRNFGIGGSPVRDMKTWTAQEMQGKNPPYVAKELHNDKHKRKEIDSDHKPIEKKPPLTLKNSPMKHPAKAAQKAIPKHENPHPKKKGTGAGEQHSYQSYGGNLKRTVGGQ